MAKETDTENKPAKERGIRTLDELISELGVSPEQGLSDSEAENRIGKYAYNELTEEKTSAVLKFLTNFWRPIPWMIEVAVMLVFLFASLAFRAVGRSAGRIIEEVRRQFRENPKIMAGEVCPDYTKAMDLTTRAALRGMVAPGLVPTLGPAVVGVLFRLDKQYDATMVLAALLMVGTIAGILMASFMNNGGGAWDNAKKYIEDGRLKDESGNVLVKGLRPTRPLSSGILWAIHSRTRRDRRCTCWSSSSARSPSSCAPCSSEPRAVSRMHKIGKRI